MLFTRGHGARQASGWVGRGRWWPVRSHRAPLEVSAAWRGVVGAFVGLFVGLLLGCHLLEGAALVLAALAFALTGATGGVRASVVDGAVWGFAGGGGLCLLLVTEAILRLGIGDYSIYTWTAILIGGCVLLTSVVTGAVGGGIGHIWVRTQLFADIR